MVRTGFWTPAKAARHNLAQQLIGQIVEVTLGVGATVYTDLLAASFAKTRLENLID